MPEERKIPKLFHSTVEESTFKSCSKCDRELIESELQYMIEKVFIPNDVLFEFALCQYCIEAAQKCISEETMQKLMAFNQNEMFGKIKLINDFMHSGIEEIQQKLHDENPEQDFSRCSVVGHFVSDAVHPQMPFICVSEETVHEMQELYSRKTRDDIDDFMDFVNLVPPGFEKLFDPIKPLII